MGFALVPASLQNMRLAGVAYRALAEGSPTVEIGLAWRAAGEPPAVQALVAVAQARARRHLQRQVP